MPHSLPSDIRIAIVPLLLTGLKHAKVGVALKEVGGRYIYLAGMPEFFPALSAAEATDVALFGEEIASQLAVAQKRALDSDDSIYLELRVHSGDYRGICECSVQNYHTEIGDSAVLMTFVDTSEERRREDTLKALLRELTHRSKNMLAIVQSIASQTARAVVTPEEFLPKFRARLAALASAQDLVTDSNWRGARFKDLATAQFARYVEQDDERYSITGSNPLLVPNQVTHLALAIHELIANSVSTGALSRENGRVILQCSHPAKDQLAIEWSEQLGISDGFTLSPKPEKRFGSSVLERIVPTALNGFGTYYLGTDRISYRVEFPEVL